MTPAATPIVTTSDVLEPTAGRTNSTQNSSSAPAPHTATCQARCAVMLIDPAIAGAIVRSAPAIARPPQA